MIDLRDPTAAERTRVLELLPELATITSDAARDRCLAVWAAAIRAGDWPDPRRAPTLPQVPVSADHNLVAHTRRVLVACDAVGRAVGQGSLRPDPDALLEAAALHDVAKLVEYEPTEGGFGLSAIGRSLPHAAIGAQWAIDAGAPPVVSRAIYVHTPSVAAAPESIEAVILFAVDQIDADISRMSVGETPTIKRQVLGGASTR
jgi:hypothetical protein